VRAPRIGAVDLNTTATAMAGEWHHGHDQTEGVDDVEHRSRDPWKSARSSAGRRKSLCDKKSHHVNHSTGELGGWADRKNASYGYKTFDLGGLFG
jgi:hypothetical protein